MTSPSEANIARQIADLCAWILESGSPHIQMSMSLTHDLGFDSMKLMQLFAGIEELYSGITLAGWFAERCSDRGDTIGSAVRYLATAVPLAAPPGGIRGATAPAFTEPKTPLRPVQGAEFRNGWTRERTP